MLIKCACCNKQISMDSIHCIECGHPINQEKYELLFAYQYKGKVLNSPLYRDSIEKLDVLKMTGKVEVIGKTYKIVEFISSGHNESVYVILDDVN